MSGRFVGRLDCKNIKKYILSMGKNGKRRLSGWGKAAVITASVLVVIGGALLGVQIWIGHKVDAMLESEPLNFGAGTCVTHVGRVRVDLARRGVVLRDVAVRTRNRAKDKKDGPSPWLEATIDKVYAFGVHYDKDNDYIYIKDISVESPSVVFHDVPSPTKAECPVQDSMPRHRRSLFVERLRVNDAQAVVNLWGGNGKTGYTVSGLDIELYDINMRGGGNASGSLSQTSQAFDTEKLVAGLPFSDARVRLDKMTYTYKNGALRMEVDTLVFDERRGSATVGRVAVLPQYSKEAYSRRVGDDTDWMQVEVHDIALDGVRLPLVANRRLFYADSCGIGTVDLSAFKDRNEPQSNSFKPTIYSAVQDIPLGMELPVIEAAGINILYEEISRGASVPGIISFDSMKVRIEGFTNRPQAADQTYVIQAQGMLLGVARLDALLTLPADRSMDRFTLHSTLASMPATAASEITEAIAGVRIVSGMLDSVEIDVEGSSSKATSTLMMYYDDLQVSILKNGREREFITAIANDMVLRSSNPRGGKFKVGHGLFERDPRRSFWNYLWKTSYESVKDVVM